MVRRSYKPDEIIDKLRKAEVLISQESTVGKANRKIGVTEQTYYLRLSKGSIRSEQQPYPSFLVSLHNWLQDLPPAHFASPDTSSWRNVGRSPSSDKARTGLAGSWQW